MSCWAGLRPRLLLSLVDFLGSGLGSDEIPSLAVDPAVESVNTLCTFLSCSTGICCRSFWLRASSSFSRSISARSVSS
jgi:hypothetical protein